jgi:uncharacterized membrane protein YqiK
MTEMPYVSNFVIGLGTLVALVVFMRITGMLRYISNTRVGIVEKLWSLKGSIERGLIALQGEAGFQADVLRGGFHLFFLLQYRIHTTTLVTIQEQRGSRGLGLCPTERRARESRGWRQCHAREGRG